MTTYYKRQIEQIQPADEHGYKLQISSSAGSTNWINLNLDSIEALETFLSEVKRNLTVKQPITVKV